VQLSVSVFRAQSHPGLHTHVDLTEAPQKDNFKVASISANAKLSSRLTQTNAGLRQRLFRTNDLRYSVCNAKDGSSRRKRGAGTPVFDDHPFANRRPALDPIILADDNNGTALDFYFAVGGPQWLRHRSRHCAQSCAS
jgi:hypothetical protein